MDLIFSFTSIREDVLNLLILQIILSWCLSVSKQNNKENAFEQSKLERRTYTCLGWIG